MFFGHFAAALAAKKVAPKANLGLMFVATLFLDLLWPLFLFLGLEEVRIVRGFQAASYFHFISYPFSHSLLFALFWSVLFGAAYYAFRRHRGEALVLGALVLSHWGFDFLMHKGSMPLWPGSDARVGLGLWDSMPITLGLEFSLLAVGISLYRSTTRPVSRAGAWSFWSLIAVLHFFLLNSLFGPQVPSEREIAWMGILLWVTLPWGMWIERKRSVVSGDSAPVD